MQRRRSLALAGVAGLALACAAAPAMAQNGPVEIQAGSGEGDLSGEGAFTLAGGVQIDRDGQRLTSDTATVDQKSNLVSASGDVVVTTPEGGIAYADQIVLSGDMKSGMAKGFATRIQNVDFGEAFRPGEVKIAADTAIVFTPTTAELNKVIYTPCAICESDGVTPKEPTWSIQAEKVVMDENRHLVYFRDPAFRFRAAPDPNTASAPTNLVFGVGDWLINLLPWIQVSDQVAVVGPLPVTLYMPDQTAPRTSGFLPPRVNKNERRGLSYEQRYYQVLSPSADLTYGPQINTNLNPFLDLDLRKRFWSGTTDTRAGYTFERDVETDGLKFGEATSRSYILANGDFRPVDDWRLGYTAERVSDPFLFDKYGQSDVFTQRGLYAADDHRLISQAYAVRHTRYSYVSATAISVQGLRPTDYNRTFPLIAPLIEARFAPQQPIAGGRLLVEANAVGLQRDQMPSLIGPPPPGPGVDSRRASLKLDWRRTDTLANGVRVSPFLLGHADLYSLTDLPAPYASKATVSQGQATVGVELSDPLIRRDASSTTVLEPLFQALVSSKADIDPRVPNEDSQVLEFDETNLMSPDKFAGFDRFVGGPQLNLGLRATTNYDSGKMVSGLIGRSFSNGDNSSLYPARSGLAQDASDWIAAVEASPRRNMTLFVRARVDGDDGALRRIEAGVDVKNSHTEGYIRYLRDDMDVTGQKRQDLDLNVETLVSDHWGVSVYAVRDLEGSGWRRRDFTLFYQDDCLRLDLIFRNRDEFTNTAAGTPSVRPSSSFNLRLTLATLGNTR